MRNADELRDLAQFQVNSTRRSIPPIATLPESHAGMPTGNPYSECDCNRSVWMRCLITTGSILVSGGAWAGRLPARRRISSMRMEHYRVEGDLPRRNGLDSGCRMECSVSIRVDERRSLSSIEDSALLRPLGARIWETSTGRQLQHTVYSLLGCPPIEQATYLLVYRTPGGSREVRAVRRTRSPFSTVNLARIRRAGARHGANEVHVFRGAANDEARRELVSELVTTWRCRSRSARRNLGCNAAIP